ncbi:protein of unknown function (plasmid) [Caballeronia sp. S22]
MYGRPLGESIFAAATWLMWSHSRSNPFVELVCCQARAEEISEIAFELLNAAQNVGFAQWTLPII